MLGAIIGDIVGSRFEFNNTNRMDFELFTEESTFTDDTICTVAIADAILNGKSYKDSLLEWCRKYPHPKGGYGASFSSWIRSLDPQPYNSFGNGSAMRVSPVGWLFNGYRNIMKEAKLTASVSHNHPEGVKGAQAIAYAIYLARTGKRYQDIADSVRKMGYEFDTFDWIKENNKFNETCQETVPQALCCFFASNDFESCIRLAVSIGGDSDTIAAIAGSVAEAYYGIPERLKSQAISRLPTEMKIIINQFYKSIAMDTNKFLDRIKDITKKVNTLRRMGLFFGMEVLSNDKYKICANRDWVEVLTPSSPIEKFEKVAKKLERDIIKNR